MISPGDTAHNDRATVTQHRREDRAIKQTLDMLNWERGSEPDIVIDVSRSKDKRLKPVDCGCFLCELEREFHQNDPLKIPRRLGPGWYE